MVGRLTSLIPILVSGSCLLSACGDQASFKVIDEKAPAAATSADQTATDSSSDSVAKRCEDPNQTRTVTQKIIFPDPGIVCDWGKDDNLTPAQLWVKARREQYVPLELDAQSTICRIEFDFPDQDMYFDDEIFLLYNNFVLTASIDYSNYFQKVDELSVYDWPAIRDKKYNADARNPYCLGAQSGKGSCTMPYTETHGSMKLSFDGSLFQKIESYSPVAMAQRQFGFVTIGDNDSRDCRHSDLQYTVHVTVIDN